MPAFPNDLTNTLTDLVDALLACTDAPGLGLSVFTADSILLERGFGRRDRESYLPVTPATIFGVASITKSLTALTTLRLRARGLVDLGDPVTRYLDFGSLWRHGPAATLAHFLSHTSGLPATPTMTWLRHASQLEDPVTAGPALAEAKLTLAPGAIGMPPADGPLGLDAVDAAAAAMEDGAALDRLSALAAEVGSFQGMAGWLGRNAPPLAAPGELYSYSNDAFCLVGGILEGVAGAPFAALAEREVLGPLGMRRSRFDLEGVLADADHATLYARDATGAVRRSPAWETTGVMQGGGMLKSTLQDLRAYVRHLLAGGPAVAEMTRPRADSAPGAAYGLGLSVVRDYHGLTIVKHGGSLKGVSSAIGFVPELGVGVVVLCNLAGVPAEQLLVDVVNACAGLPLGGSPYAPEPGVAADHAAAEHADLIGEYLSGEPYGRLRLLADTDGGLRVVAGWPEAELPAFLAGPDEVAVTYPDGRRSAVRFLRDEAGKVWSAQAGRVMLRL